MDEAVWGLIIGIIIIIILPVIIGIIVYSYIEPEKKENNKKTSDNHGFCKNCGAKISDDSKFCKYCGTQIDIENNPIVLEEDNEINIKKEIKKDSPHFNKLSIISFILSIIPIFTGLDLLGIIALILGTVGLSQISKTKEKGKVLAIIAIILGAVFGIILDLIENNI